ncbi:MAG: ATP-binding protein, partial [Ramlibacter sp.]
QPVFGRLTGVAVLQIAYPVRTGAGELKFVLLASLSLARLPEAQRQDILMPGMEILLVDRAGTVLASSGGGVSNVAARRPGTSLAGTALLQFAVSHPQGAVKEVASPDGEAYIWAAPDSALFQQSGIQVLVGLPRKLLAVTANREFAQDCAVLAGAALLIFAAVWLLAELGIRRHLGTIGDMVRRLGRNDPKPRSHRKPPRGELGVLMQLLEQGAQDQRVQRTAMEELNARALESQRLEAIGQLTGGVAHDFNNLLTVILGNAEVLQEQLAGNPKLEPMAGMVVSAAERGADLTQRLLAFARKQPLEPGAVDINQLVAGTEALLRRALGEQVEVAFKRGSGLWPALVDPAQLDNALLNLCLNARDAMPQGGCLTIETANTQLDQDYARQHAEVKPGPYVMLAVSDSGTGIAAENLARVLEPFFTTKEKGKGSGLGLAMIYGFVKQSGGHVNIYSEQGHGTTVKLYLPRAPEAAMPPPTRAAPGQAQPGGNESILLVEDDALVRRYANDQLAGLGYRVIQAHDGAQALETLRGGQPIDLLFTDVVMPGMSGRQLADAACRMRPGLKVLYTSGYTESAIVHHGRLDPGVQLLGKPYRREELAQRVRAALVAVPEPQPADTLG